MSHEASVGPSNDGPPPDPAREARATTEGVDAQNANDFDAQHALAGVEAKPFSPAAPGSHPAEPTKQDAISQNSDVRKDPGLVSERRNPARDDGVNSANADESSQGDD